MKTETLKTICIMCPMGCDIEVIKNGEDFTVSGNTCKRGEKYGIAEMTAPVRTVTSLAKYKNGVVSVKTSEPIPKDKIGQVLAEIKKNQINGEVSCGDIIAKNIANTDANIIVTANI